jgi:hypothetical protein
MNEKGNMSNVTEEREENLHEEKEQHNHTSIVLLQPYPF